MYEDIMTPGTAVTAPSGHQPPPTTWLQQHQLHQLERTQESIKWSGVFLAQGEQRGTSRGNTSVGHLREGRQGVNWCLTTGIVIISTTPVNLPQFVKLKCFSKSRNKEASKDPLPDWMLVTRDTCRKRG